MQTSHAKSPTVGQVSSLMESYARAHDLRFLGLVSLGPEPDFDRFEAWLAQGKHGDMSFLERNRQCRRDPTELMPGSRISALFGFNYYCGDKLRGDVTWPRIAQYARMRDYHKTLRVLLSGAGEALGGELGYDVKFRVCVDSAPLLERALAARGGHGFIGKNTCFIIPEAGSWFLLAELILDLEMQVEAPACVEPTRRSNSGGCGSCRRCQVHCPTGALATDYQLDARKCISYHTIENRSLVPVEIWPHLDRYIFGCDICQLVCPYNRGAQVNDRTPRKLTGDIDPFDLFCLNQDRYVAKFGGTPVTRAKLSGLRRNGLISLVVRNDARLAEALAMVEKDQDGLLLATAAQISEYRASIPGKL